MAVREIEMETAHQAIEEFAHKALGDVAGALTASLVVIGDKLGLYKALTKGAATPAELASRTGFRVIERRGIFPTVPVLTRWIRKSPARLAWLHRLLTRLLPIPGWCFLNIVRFERP